MAVVQSYHGAVMVLRTGKVFIAEIVLLTYVMALLVCRIHHIRWRSAYHCSKYLMTDSKFLASIPMTLIQTMEYYECFLGTTKDLLSVLYLLGTTLAMISDDCFDVENCFFYSCLALICTISSFYSFVSVSI